MRYDKIHLSIKTANLVVNCYCFKSICRSSGKAWTCSTAMSRRAFSKNRLKNCYLIMFILELPKLSFSVCLLSVIF